MEVKLINDHLKQLQLLLAVGGAMLSYVPYNPMFNKIGLDKEAYLWLRSEIKINGKKYFPDLLKNAVSQYVEKDNQQ